MDADARIRFLAVLNEAKERAQSHCRAVKEDADLAQIMCYQVAATISAPSDLPSLLKDIDFFAKRLKSDADALANVIQVVHDKKAGIIENMYEGVDKEDAKNSEEE